MADNVTPCPAEMADDYQKKCRSSFQKGREVQEKMNAEAAKNSTAEPQPGDQTTLYTAKAAEVQKQVDGKPTMSTATQMQFQVYLSRIDSNENPLVHQGIQELPLHHRGQNRE